MPLRRIEYIIAKSITRNGSVKLADWNKAWHEHNQEIETGRVQVLALSPDETKKVAELISTTDGLIFHLWSDDEKVPGGRVVIPQSVGHVNLTESELKDGAKQLATLGEFDEDRCFLNTHHGCHLRSNTGIASGEV